MALTATVTAGHGYTGRSDAQSHWSALGWVDSGVKWTHGGCVRSMELLEGLRVSRERGKTNTLGYVRWRTSLSGALGWVDSGVKRTHQNWAALGKFECVRVSGQWDKMILTTLSCVFIDADISQFSMALYPALRHWSFILFFLCRRWWQRMLRPYEMTRGRPWHTLLRNKVSFLISSLSDFTLYFFIPLHFSFSSFSSAFLFWLSCPVRFSSICHNPCFTHRLLVIQHILYSICIVHLVSHRHNDISLFLWIILAQINYTCSIFFIFFSLSLSSHCRVFPRSAPRVISAHNLILTHKHPDFRALGRTWGA